MKRIKASLKIESYRCLSWGM